MIGANVKKALAAALAMGIATWGGWADPARAETDCEHYARIMAALRSGAGGVTEGDMAQAMATERRGGCQTATQAASAPPRPAASPAPAPARMATVPGLVAGIPAAALNSGMRLKCPSMHPDPASQNPCDWFALALAYQRGFGVAQDPAQAIAWLEKAARAHHAAAQMGLGEAYSAGYGPLAANPAGAHHWMVMGAQNGNAVAARLLGSYAEHGTGQPVDYSQAAYWYGKALERGDLAGGVWLGVLTASGKGVPRDTARAVELFRMAADEGNPDGMYYLGDFYRMGVGVPFDVAQARYWLRKAQAAGDKDAGTVLAYMDEVDRRYASIPAAHPGGGAFASAASGPSLADQAMEAHRRQYRENCAAAAKGASRPCYIP